MAGLLFVVSRTKPGTYAFMKLVSESEHEVILDRRKVDRRRINQPATPERRHGERRRRDVTTELQKIGWALVPRYVQASVQRRRPEQLQLGILGRDPALKDHAALACDGE